MHYRSRQNPHALKIALPPFAGRKRLPIDTIPRPGNSGSLALWDEIYRESPLRGEGDSLSGAAPCAGQGADRSRSVI